VVIVGGRDEGIKKDLTEPIGSMLRHITPAIDYFKIEPNGSVIKNF
jgi:hypothetical protein